MRATRRLHVPHVSRMAGGDLPDETLFELVEVSPEVLVEKHVPLRDWYVLECSLDTTPSFLVCAQDISREVLLFIAIVRAYKFDGIILPSL